MGLVIKLNIYMYVCMCMCVYLYMDAHVLSSLLSLFADRIADALAPDRHSSFSNKGSARL